MISTRCCSRTRIPITPGLPNGRARRPERGSGSGGRTRRPHGPVRQPGKNDGKVTSYLLRPAFYRTAFSLLRRGASRIIPIAEVSAFGDGERIDVPGSPRAVHAPGHTPGSAAILVDSRRTLFTGDVMAMDNPLTGRTGPQIMPSGLNQDTPQALASLDALLGIDADLLLPGHGDPWRQGTAEAVGRARAAGPS